jgi:hypothetical protein
MQYRVTYARREDLQRDMDTQITKGGLFVMVPPPEGIQYGTKLPLEIVCPNGVSLQFEGGVLAAVPGQGIALAISSDHVVALKNVLLQCTSDRSDVGPVHATVDLSAPTVAAPATTARAQTLPGSTDAALTWDTLSIAEKMRLAQHGGRDERAAAMRDINRNLHTLVLRNPRITVEEIVVIARNAQIHTDLLRMIADRSEWVGRSTVAEALVRNPRTPNDIGMRCLAHCSAEAVKQMAKGIGAPPHIVQAARKRVIG